MEAGLAMSAKIIVVAYFIFSFGLPARASESADVLPGPAATEAAETAPRRGTLYRIRHRDKTSYLFGTVHMGKESFFPLEPEVRHALAASARLVIELDIREHVRFQAALAKHGVYEAGTDVRQHLSEPTLRKLGRALRQAGMEPEAVARYKPWLVANLLLGLELEQHGFQRSQGVENYLLAAAIAQQKPVLELESADYQLALFDTMDDAQQETYLLESLADLDDGNSLKRNRGLIEAWNSADPREIEQALRQATGGGTVSSAFMQRTLLDKRNPEMAATIEHIMQDDQGAFIGVGLLHMVGDNGLPQLLSQRGYRVEKIY